MTDTSEKGSRPSTSASNADQAAEHHLYAQFDYAKSCGYGLDWTINGKEAEELVSEFMDDSMSAELWGKIFCPYCNTLLRHSEFHDYADPESDEEWHFDRTYELQLCERCAYWEFMSSEGGNKCMDSQTMVFGTAVAKKFEDSLPQGCPEEFAQYLRRHPDTWHRVEPKAFEKIVADIIKANYGNCEVIHIGKPSDGGVDVVFIDSGKRKWLVQAKRRTKATKSEGVETLRSVLGTLLVHGEQRGIIVTTADSFSYCAQRECAGVRDKGYKVQLIDKGVLDRMLSPIIPKHPWLDFLKQPLFEEMDDTVRRHFMSDLSDTNQLDLFRR